MQIIRYLIIFYIILILPAHAYIGPGIGAGLLATILGFLLTILVALFVIIYFPIKKIFIKLKDRNKKKKK